MFVTRKRFQERVAEERALTAIYRKQIEELHEKIYQLHDRAASLRADAEKHRASVARLAEANAKRKADALAKKAGA